MATGQQTDRQKALLNICDDFLEQSDGPLHYKMLTQILIDSGLWAEPWGKEPDQILYSALHNDVKRHGDKSRFVFMGQGIFCSRLIEGAEYLETPAIRENITPRDKFTRPGDSETDTRRRREAYTEQSRCGNCHSLRWTGPQVMRQEVGSCSRYEETRRACVYKTSEACPLWAPRTMAQRNADRLDRADDILVVLQTVADCYCRPRG